MKYSLSHFGLVEKNNEISSDGGKTFLPKYKDMPSETFDELVLDVESFLEHPLTFNETDDLIEILS